VFILSQGKKGYRNHYLKACVLSADAGETRESRFCPIER